MYKIKQLPEDFFVREIARHEFREKGDYAYYIMRKKNYTTQRAAERVADFLGVKREDFSYAGLKDRNAVTEQFVSIRSRESPTEIKLPDIELKLLGRGYVKIGIGELDGNEFKITVRNLEISDIIRLYNRFAEEEMLEDFQLSESGLKVLFNELKEITNSRGIFFPNYFGNQRFSKNNYEVGRSLLLRDFKGAINKILCFDIPEESVKNHWENWDELLKIARAESSKEILKHLSQNSRDYVGALRRIPKRILRLYIGSFQAFLFNEALSAKVRSRFEKYFEVNYKLGRMAFPEKIIDKPNNEKISLPGFGSDKVDEQVSKILEREGISQRSFIIREMPELSAEGTERDAFCAAERFTITGISRDELNSGRFKIELSFYLRKGSYATILIDFLFGQNILN